MTVPSPLLSEHARRGAILSEYGAAEGREGVAVVAAMAPIELEYAAIRRSCILIDQPHRGVIEVTGSEAIAFLNRMITQELKTLTPGAARRSFWLNRKGRIDADLRLWSFEGRTLLDVDIHAAARAVQGLSAYIIADDVAIREISQATHRLALHGPASAAVLDAIIDDPAQAASITALAPDRCQLVHIKANPVVIAREDQTGEIGLELMCAAEFAPELYNLLLESGGWLAAERDTADGAHAAGAPTPGNQRAAARTRPAGWHAFNIARIEAGSPLYNIDFGPDSLPAETGIFDDRVSLTKGCYLGQEIVARLHARGHPKQRLMGIKLARDIPLTAPGEPGQPTPRQPETGSPVMSIAADGGEGEVIGAVTSSALSPMLGQTPICFAMVKFEHAVPGKDVMLAAEGGIVKGQIQDTLRFYARP